MIVCMAMPIIPLGVPMTVAVLVPVVAINGGSRLAVAMPTASTAMGVPVERAFAI